MLYIRVDKVRMVILSFGGQLLSFVTACTSRRSCICSAEPLSNLPFARMTNSTDKPASSNNFKLGFFILKYPWKNIYAESTHMFMLNTGNNCKVQGNREELNWRLTASLTHCSAQYDKHSRPCSGSECNCLAI